MLAFLTQSNSTNDVAASAGVAALVAIMLALFVGLFIIYLVAMWRIFTKMGQPGWVGIIPILNVYAIFKLAGREWWWILLFFVPCINIIASWFLADDLAKLFGKDTLWSLLLFFFGPIGYLMLAFGNAQYIGPNEQVV